MEGHLSLQSASVAQSSQSLPIKPLVVWDDYPRRGRLVIAACSRSREFGVTPQMPLSHAVELLQQGIATAVRDSVSRSGNSQEPVQRPGRAANSRQRSSRHLKQSNARFSIQRRDVTADDHALGRIAKLIQQQITPIVAIESLDVKKWAGISRYQRESLLCDITGVSHLYGGESALCHAAVSLLSRYGLVCRAAVADTVSESWAFARYSWMNSSLPICIASGLTGETVRNQLPVESLRLFPDAYKNLKRLGVDRVGQLLALPRSGLISRFGKHLVLQISRILGERDEPLSIYCAPGENRSSLILEYPTQDLPLLQDRVQLLVSQVCKKLLDTQHGVLRLLLRLDLVDHQSQQFEVGLFAPTVDASQISGLVNQQLEMSRLPGLVQEMELAATLTGPLRTVQNDLFATSNHESWADGVNDVELNRFVNALGGRLGKGSVVAVSPSRNPLPEKAIQATSLEGLQKKKLGLRFLNKPKGQHSQVTQGEAASALQAPVEDVFLNQSYSSSKCCPSSESGELSAEVVRSRKEKKGSFDLGIQNPSPNDPMRRPSFLLPKPTRLRVAFSSSEFVETIHSNALPDQIQLAGKNYSIIHFWGPERIETGWWEGSCVRRDYYRVELDDGQWWWIFRAFPTAGSRDRRSSWMLHGYFD